MKYRTMKRINKHYEEIYNKEKQTPEIDIAIGGCHIFITEQQCGHELSQPYVRVYNPNDCVTYCMDFDDFLAKISK